MEPGFRFRRDQLKLPGRNPIIGLPVRVGKGVQIEVGPEISRVGSRGLGLEELPSEIPRVISYIRSRVKFTV